MCVMTDIQRSLLWQPLTVFHGHLLTSVCQIPCIYSLIMLTCSSTGVLAVFCRSLLDHLDRLPGDARTMVGLLTFDSSLHFYNFPVSMCPYNSEC
jgi:hypothetical protein